MSDSYENCYCLKKKSNSLICKNETKERDVGTIIIIIVIQGYMYLSIFEVLRLYSSTLKQKKYIGSSACSNYMHIYMLTKLHCNIFYKHIIRLFGLTKQQLEAGFQTTGGMILFCYSTCIIFVTHFLK